MKVTKRSISLFLSVVLLLGVCPISFTGAAANEVAVPIEAITTNEAAQDEPAAQPLVIEPGYHFCEKINVDAEGRTIYYIEDEPSEYGLVHGKWIYSDGSEAKDPDIREAYPDKPSLDKADPLPSSYDARNDNLIMPVEDQVSGTCWAHAAISCIETSYIKQGFDDSIDLSEYHTVWYSKNGYFEGVDDSANDGETLEDPMLCLTQGGNTTDVWVAASSFSGPVLEERYPLTATRTSDMLEDMKNTFTYSERFKKDAVLKEVLVVNLNKDNDDEVKQAILDYGSVKASYYSGDYYYPMYYWNVSDDVPVCFYCPEDISTNHAIAIVGWDDSFSKENFSPDCQPEHDGAWLAKNSWGTDFGNDGYFWISYEDKTICLFNAFNLSDAADFENVYLHDGYGYLTYKNVNAAANVFTATGNQYITKVSYGSKTSMDYVLKIYKNLPSNYISPEDGTLVYTQRGNTDNQRYIDVMGDVCISDGEIFSVVLEAPRAYFEGTGSAEVRTTAGLKQSYYIDGADGWKDAKEQGTLNNGCIRVVAKTIAPSEHYKIKFKDGTFFEETVLSDGATVELPALEGCTYTFTYNNQDFDGTGIDKDMTVSVHCYPTFGKIDEDKDPCTTEYKCIYCGIDILPPVTEHTYQVETFAATANSPGHTKYTCCVCSNNYYENFSLFNGAVGGMFESFFWQYYNGTLSVFSEGIIPDFASENDVPWNEYKNSITKLIVNDGTTRIGNYAFGGLGSLTEMTLGSTVKEIGAYCFMNASSLTEFTCPAELEKIEENAFYRATSLTTINYNSKISSFGERVFYYCNSLTEATIPGTVKNPSYGLFSNCNKLKKIIFSEGVTSSNQVFWSCPSLEEVVFSSTVVTGRFTNTGDLHKYTVSPDNEAYCAVDGILFSKDMKTLVSYPAGKSGIYYNIPDCVTAIGSGAFNFTENLVYLDMSCQITSFPYYTINQTRSIEYVNLPAGLTKMDSSAIQSTKIPNMYIPSTVNQLSGKPIVASGSYFVPNFYTDTDTAAICTFASEYNYSCTTQHTTHNYSTLALDVQPNCSEPGMTIYTCECGNFIYNEIEPNGEHRLENPVVVPPTCTQSGYTTYTCAICSEQITNSHVDPSGHSFEWVTDTAETCVANGIKHEECSVCHVKQNENTVIPANGNHNYTAQDVKSAALKSAANCTQAAEYYYSCNICGRVESKNSHTFRSGAPAGHRFIWVTDLEPTCGAAGKKHEKCTVCESTRSMNTSIPSTGNHSYTACVTSAAALKSAATCLSAARYYYSCSVCGNVERNATHTFLSGNALAHSYTGKLKNNQNGTHSRLCANGCGQYGTQENCNYVFSSSARGSNCQETGKDTYTCACGAKRTEGNSKYGPHKFVKGKCSLCSATDPDYVDCSCNCHSKDFFKSFFWKIQVFFWKLFKVENKRACSCGAKHW